MHLLDSFGLGFLGFVPFVVIISVLIFFHELGHFLVGRWFGVKVMTFSIGFGPELLGFDDRKGTHWRVAAIPLGGYVRFFGDANAASMPDEEKNKLMTAEERGFSLFHKPVWQRIAVVAAGPIANFILAVFVFAAAFSIYGYPTSDAVVGAVQPGSPAEKAGLQKGDRIVEVDGTRVTLFRQLPPLIGPASGRAVKMAIERGSTTFDVAIVPQMQQVMDENGKPVTRGTIGVAPGGLVRLDPATALWTGAKETAQSIETSTVFFAKLVVGQGDARQVSGIVGIAVASRNIAQDVGLGGLIVLTAALSVSIGFINLLPIPVLDGGHLVFYLIEAVRGRPVGARAQELSFGIGLMLIVTMTVLVLGNDLSHLFGGK
ncbi:RIP metalloprotease RseP [Labrys monachus]|uniref:Zinc metalloprotease n=1 Tax=Labrys monachus TaxID=217067 RepID=A0ABU0FGG4_9HYPH|nr:RIP metalloprotease RseP [Labrys monachus]MDQ0393224.1 regulator of sigma E protease [Labrys monachus]